MSKIKKRNKRKEKNDKPTPIVLRYYVWWCNFCGKYDWGLTVSVYFEEKRRNRFICYKCLKKGNRCFETDLRDIDEDEKGVK